MTATQSGGSGGLVKSLGTRDVFVAGTALVVATSTLVTDFIGYFTLGLSFVMAILVAFVINLCLGMSAAELAVAYPKAGAIYEYGRDVFGGTTGRFAGLFLGLTFVGMFLLVGPGETAAGGFGLQALFNTGSGLNWFIVILVIAAAIPNLMGIRVAAKVSAVLLVGMLAIRWIFGIAGFLGLGDVGSWSASNLNTGGPGAWDWFGGTGLFATGLVMAFWSFVGIEFVCSLTEEVENPRKAMPRGIIYGLLVIMGTSLLMGIGVTGATTASGAPWAEVALGAAGCDGACPQLAVGEEFFGGFGRGLMALASILATLGSMTVAIAAISRIIFSIARDGDFFGPLSGIFSKVNPNTGTPVNAIVLFTIGSTIPALYSSDVTMWIFSGAYLWVLLYIAYNGLALFHRLSARGADPVYGSWFPLVALAGIGLSIMGLYYAFLGAHDEFGGRSIKVLIIAAIATGLAAVLNKNPNNPEAS
jgi:amino acid transporter